MPDTDSQKLIRWFDRFQNVAVAFSGGVDSSVVLAAALRSSAQHVVAVTAHSPSVAQWQLELAESVARGLGATHQIVQTDEIELPEYVANDSRRCFHCKRTLYHEIDQHFSRADSASQTDGSTNRVIVSGTNADDLGDYRPGIEAGELAGVQTPLADLGFGKSVVREIAAEFGLSNADLPASPCLSSRLAYGVEVTLERLKRIDQAETYLRDMGLIELRVRLHQGELARIEVPAEQIGFLVQEEQRKHLCEAFLSFGFHYISIDLQGFSSGSMNRQLVSIGESS